MIITTDDFKFGAYVPNRDDAPNSDIIGNEPILQGFIDEYVQNCLVETLGWELFSELQAELVEGVLPPDADQKWLDLVNGSENYRGMKQGMLVGYVYFYWLQNDIVDYSTTGTQRVTSDKQENVRPDSKMVVQYNKFYDQAIGTFTQGPSMVYKDDGRVGIIYGGMSGSNYKSMYEFLRENSETYSNWNPSLTISQVNMYDI